MIDRDVIDLLACPTSHRALRPMPANRLDRLNERIKAGRCHYVDGQIIKDTIEAALITDNGTLIYRIDNDIPVLLVERGIAARQIRRSLIYLSITALAHPGSSRPIRTRGLI